MLNVIATGMVKKQLKRKKKIMKRMKKRQKEGSTNERDHQSETDVEEKTSIRMVVDYLYYGAAVHAEDAAKEKILRQRTVTDLRCPFPCCLLGQRGRMRGSPIRLPAHGDSFGVVTKLAARLRSLLLHLHNEHIAFTFSYKASAGGRLQVSIRRKDQGLLEHHDEERYRPFQFRSLRYMSTENDEWSYFSRYMPPCSTELRIPKLREGADSSEEQEDEEEKKRRNMAESQIRERQEERQKVIAVIEEEEVLVIEKAPREERALPEHDDQEDDVIIIEKWPPQLHAVEEQSKKMLIDVEHPSALSLPPERKVKRKRPLSKADLKAYVFF